MDYREIDVRREFVCTLDHGGDWRTQIEAFAAAEGIDAAFFVGLGAVQDAEVLFYDQDRMEYDSVVFTEPLEVASCVGNVSLLDDEPFAHTHVVLSCPDGEAVAGHLHSGTVWAGELSLRTFEDSLERTHDEATDLDLWEL